MKQIIVTKELATVGLRVVRGKDWDYEDQDRMDLTRTVVPGATGIGTVVGEPKASPNWVRVKWDSGLEDIYPVGGSSGYALYVYSPIDVTSSNVIVTKDNARVGMEVTRGRDWEWGYQDVVNGKQVKGRIVETQIGSPGWVKVQWEGGVRCGYRVGSGNKYDLYMYSPSGDLEASAKREQEVEARKALDALAGSIVDGRGYDIYGKSLKPNTQNGDTADAYTGKILYLPPESYNLQRGERPEGRRLQG